MLKLECLYPEEANAQQGLTYMLYTMVYKMSH